MAMNTKAEPRNARPKAMQAFLDARERYYGELDCLFDIAREIEEDDEVFARNVVESRRFVDQASEALREARTKVIKSLHRRCLDEALESGGPEWRLRRREYARFVYAEAWEPLPEATREARRASIRSRLEVERLAAARRDRG